MNEIKIFENEQFGQVRVIEKDNEPWFVAKDICDVLNHTNSRVALSRIDDDEKGVSKVYTLGGEQEMKVINEYGLYSLILTSNLPKAKEFKRWVTHEILPSIRKHGFYMNNDVLEKTLENPQFLIDILQKYQQEKARVKMLIHAKKLYTSTEIAKEIGFKSAKALNEDLKQKKIQYKVNKTWVLSSDYANKGFTSIKEQVLDNGKVIYDRKWTGTGREFLLNFYKEEV